MKTSNYIAAAVIVVLVVIAFWGTIFYVGAHFAAKYW